MQEKINIDTTLGNFVAKYPIGRKVFDRFGLDYCCGGKQDIKAAAEEKNIEINELISNLETAIEATDEKNIEKTWLNEPLSNLVEHIMLKHHAFLRKELPYVDKLLEKVVMVHGPNHRSFLYMLSDTFQELKKDLEKHLDDEETLLFPNVKEIENTAKKSEEQKETFNKIVELLYVDHDDAGEALRHIRNLTENYTLPADACASFEALYQALQDIEDNLHAHIHLENTILFPGLEKLLV